MRKGIVAGAGAVGLGALGAATAVRLADARRAEAAWAQLARLGARATHPSPSTRAW